MLVSTVRLQQPHLSKKKSDTLLLIPFLISLATPNWSITLVITLDNKFHIYSPASFSHGILPITNPHQCEIPTLDTNLKAVITQYNLESHVIPIRLWNDPDPLISMSWSSFQWSWSSFDRSWTMTTPTMADGRIAPTPLYRVDVSSDSSTIDSRISPTPLARLVVLQQDCQLKSHWCRFSWWRIVPTYFSEVRFHCSKVWGLGYSKSSFSSVLENVKVCPDFIFSIALSPVWVYLFLARKLYQSRICTCHL